MSRLIKTLPLFIFFCLISCDQIGPYRDIEISIDGTDYAMIYIYRMPDTTHYIYATPFDREYEAVKHISHIPDGHYLIRISVEKNKKLVSVDTTVNYTGRFAFGVWI